MDIGKQYPIFKENQVCLKDSIEYLGHVVIVEGVSPDPSKVTAIQEWLMLTNIK